MQKAATFLDDSGEDKPDEPKGGGDPGESSRREEKGASKRETSE